MDGDLALGGKVAGQAPDVQRPVIVGAEKGEIPVVIPAARTGADLRLQASV